jgi:hypothetical protein
MAQGAAILIRGSRGGSHKVGTDWCGNVNPLLSRSSTPEYQGDCTGKGQPALRRAHAAHHSTPYVVSLDTQDDDDDEQKVEVGQCASSADQPLAHCAESAAAHSPVSGRQAELAPRLLA